MNNLAVRTGVLAAIVAGLGMWGAVSSALGQAVGVQFAGSANALSTNNDTAGVVAQQYWNVETANAGNSISALVDSTDTTVAGLTLTYTSSYNVGGLLTGTPTGFQELYSNHLESPYAAPVTGGVSSNRVTVYLTNIPYATYDVYVYTPNQGRHLTVYEGTGNASVGPNGIAASDSTQSSYVLNDNYVLFSGLTGSTQYFVASDATNSGGGGFNSGFAGIQIVNATPEPASVVLLAMGGLLALSRRRHARA